jgi:hypothetical protein
MTRFVVSRNRPEERVRRLYGQWVDRPSSWRPQGGVDYLGF